MQLEYQDTLEVSDGNGPVDALAGALMRALLPAHPALNSIELVDYVDPYVPAYKIGSGDITWLEIIEYISKKINE